MKSIVPPPLYFSMYPLKTRQSEPSAKPSQESSPYLRAILSGKGGSTNRGTVVRMVNSDKLAAIRYIKESQRRP